MRFVFTSCLVPFSIAIMGHRSDSELFIYVAASMSWNEDGRSDRLRYVQTRRLPRMEKHQDCCGWISTLQALPYLPSNVATHAGGHLIHLHLKRSLLWIIYWLEAWKLSEYWSTLSSLIKLGPPGSGVSMVLSIFAEMEVNRSISYNLMGLIIIMGFILRLHHCD